jgi:hypothetical protein
MAPPGRINSHNVDSQTPIRSRITTPVISNNVNQELANASESLICLDEDNKEELYYNNKTEETQFENSSFANCEIKLREQSAPRLPLQQAKQRFDHASFNDPHLNINCLNLLIFNLI